MRFRPCIDIHNGRVKQIVGSTLTDDGEGTRENFVAEEDAAFYARLFRERSLSGGHIILLNPPGHPQYEKNREQAMLALKEAPGLWQVGGGINPDNAQDFLDAGASHVIVTSYVFNHGRIDEEALARMVRAVGKEHLVLDLSCRRDGALYRVVTDRWQHTSKVIINAELFARLKPHCDEFLVHAADAEGKQSGIETPLVMLFGTLEDVTVTYAGGIRSMADVDLIEAAGRARVDYTVGSALDLFGGELSLDLLCDING